MRYDNHIYKRNIKTVTLRKKSQPVSSSIIKLFSKDVLELGFDDFDLDIKNYSFEIIHCNFDWTPSDLMVSEYVDGYLDDYIRDFKNSFNTLIPYVHYSVEIPNDDMKLTKSGNYIVKVFDNDDPEDLVLTKRFIVYEELVNIKPRVKRPDKIDDRNYKQEVDFTITHSNFDINNPYQNLHVLIQQNNRWDNAVTDLKPLFVKNNELTYDYAEENVFEGENEFRFFNSKSINYQTVEISKIVYDSSIYNFYLADDLRRTFKQYYSRPDINGNYLPDNENGDDASSDADYIKVHFSLPMEAPLINGNLYVFGNLADWKFKDEFRMKYNYKKHLYEICVMLKQGYYNYGYAFLEDKSNTGNLTLIEGNHFETENDYNIIVYYNDDTERFDRVIGATFFNSMKKN